MTTGKKKIADKIKHSLSRGSLILNNNRNIAVLHSTESVLRRNRYHKKQKERLTTLIRLEDHPPSPSQVKENNQMQKMLEVLPEAVEAEFDPGTLLLQKRADDFRKKKFGATSKDED